MQPIDTRSVITQQCYLKLKNEKARLMDQLRQIQSDLANPATENRGDSIDKVAHLSFEHSNLIYSQRIQLRLLEIERALLKIHSGSFGFCEETGDPIESERLLTIPWTALSIEGAEARESLTKRFG